MRQDDVLYLKLHRVDVCLYDPEHLKSYEYYIYLSHNGKRIGSAELHIGCSDVLSYLGHIGIHIFPVYQNCNYARVVFQKLQDIAYQQFHIEELIATCNPDNVASYHLIERMGGQLVGVYPVPKNSRLYQSGVYFSKEYVVSYQKRS